MPKRQILQTSTESLDTLMNYSILELHSNRNRERESRETLESRESDEN